MNITKLLLISVVCLIVLLGEIVCCCVVAEKLIEPSKVKPVKVIEPSPIPYEYAGQYEITYYCSGTITASGNKVNHEITGASDRTHFDFNDVVYIEGLDKPVVIHDRGGAVKGNVIDVYINDCDQAIKNGRQLRKVYKLGK